MRQRTICDYFWRDPKLCDLSQEDKATLLFFLTSPSSNIIGVYQVVWAIAGAEMGWTKDQLLVVAKRLRDRGLIDFNDEGWISVKVWWEHNSAAGAFSPKLLQNARKQIDAMPPQWREEYFLRLESLKLRGINRVSIGYPYPSDTLAPNTTSNSITTTTTTSSSDLIFPALMSQTEIQSVDDLISSLPLEARQPILDELSGAILRNVIKGGIVGYTHGLVSAAKAGKFVSNLGVGVMEKRRKENEDQVNGVASYSLLQLNPLSMKKGEEIVEAVRNRARAPLAS